MAGLYKYQEIPDRAEFSVERVFTIDAEGPLNYTLYLPIPQDLDIDGENTQELVNVEFSPKYSEKLGGTEDKWVWHNDLRSGEKNTIKIVYHFKTAKIEWDTSIKKSGTINDIPNVISKRYGGDQWPVPNFEDEDGVDTDFDGVPDTKDVDDDNDGEVDKYRIEPGNDQIQQKLLDILKDNDLYSGNDLTAIGHLNVYKVVKAIYDFIDNTCVYPQPPKVTNSELNYDYQTYGGYPKWATGTLDPEFGKSRGDCDDQSILFISLCRAAGIPAMLEIGALYNIQTDTWEGHGWANVFIPYSTSYAKDKGVEYVTPMVDIVNDIFLVRDPNRYSEWVDDGVRGYIDPETNEWEYSHLEKRYLAWEYSPSTSSANFDEKFISIEFKAFPPDRKLYI
jgi:hypothetical protein